MNELQFQHLAHLILGNKAHQGVLQCYGLLMLEHKLYAICAIVIAVEVILQTSPLGYCSTIHLVFFQSQDFALFKLLS